MNQLSDMRSEAMLGGGVKRIAAQHKKGKLTARERIDLLVDDESFEELDPFVLHESTEFGLDSQRYLGDSAITGYAKINGRKICLYAQDFTVVGGSLSRVAAQKICKIMDHAINTGTPMLGLIDSGGARIQEGVDSLAGYSDIFLRNVRASGVIPQISAVFGPAAGGASYSPALTDFVMMTKGQGQLYITGPDVIKTVTGEEISHELLGGAESHATKSGVAHFALDTEEQCIQAIKKLLSFLPQNNMEEPPFIESVDSPGRTCDTLLETIPANSNQAYDMLNIIHQVVDQQDFMEIHHLYARNIIVGYGRMNGRTVGIVANQPQQMAGVLDIDASVKASRFVRFCDAFNIPLVTFVDVPGFMPGSQQEYGGIIRNGAKLIYAYAEATVPKISVMTRKAYGGAYIVMSSKNLKGDVNYAWPSAELAVMGAEGAVNIIHRNEISQSDSPNELRQQLVQEYRSRLMNPYIAASKGLIDDVIDPKETRRKIISSLEMLENKRESLPPKKHGSLPL